MLHKASELSRVMKEWLWELWKVLGNFKAISGGWMRHINYCVLATGSHVRRLGETYKLLCVGDGKPPACPTRQKVSFPALDDSRKLYRIIRRLGGSAQTISYWLSEASSISGKTKG